MTDFNFSTESILLLITGAVGSALFINVWQERHRPTARYLSYLLIAGTIWVVSLGLGIASTAVERKILFAQYEHLGFQTVLVTLFLFGLALAGREHSFPPRLRKLITFMPVIWLTIIFTNPYHYLFWSGFTPINDGTRLIFERGPLYWGIAIYNYLLLIFTTAVIVRAAITQPAFTKRQSTLILIGIIFPWAFNIAYLTRLIPFPFDPTGLAISVTSILFSFAIFQEQIHNIIPIARDLMVDIMPDAIITIDTQGNIIDMNPAACGLANVELAQAVRKPASGLFHGWASLAEVLREENLGQTPNFPATLEDDHGRFYSLAHAALYSAQQRQVGWVIILHDITRQKQDEQSLRESEMRYRNLFTNNHAVMLLIDPQSGRIVNANSAACAYYGFSHVELTARSITDINTLSPDEVQAEMQKAQEESRSHFVFRHRLADGEVRDVEVYSGPIQLEGRSLLYSIVHDITERREIETRIRESEARYRLLAENANDVIWTMDMEGNFTYVSPSVYQLRGYTPEEALQQTMEEAVCSGSLVAAQSGFRMAFAAPKTGQRGAPAYFEIEQPRRDGTTVWTEATARLMFTTDSRPVGLVGVSRDITERRRAANQLRESNEQLQQILRGTRAGTWEWRVQTGETVFNERWAEIIGYTLAELAPVSFQTWLDHTHPDDLAHSDELLRRHFAGESDYYECEARMRHRRGHWVWVLARGRVLDWTDDGRPLRMFGTHLDISARKEAETALRASEAHYRLLAESATDLIGQLTPEGAITYASSAAEAMLGYMPDDLQWRSVYDLIHPEDVDRVQVSLMQLGTDREAVTLSFRAQHKAGHYIWIETGNRLIVDPQTDEPAALHIVARDVTARRQAEGFLQSILDSSMSGVMALRAVRDADDAIADFELVRGNRQIAQIIGRPQAELAGMRLLSGHPEMEGVAVFSDLVAVVESGEPLQREHASTRADEQTWYQITAVKLDDGLVVTLTDVTARKQAEAQRMALTLADERARLLATFIEKTAHEFRTPLSVIGVNSFIMRRLPDAHKRNEKGDIIDAQIQRLTRLMDLMLEMVKLDMNAPLENAPIDVGVLVAELCTDLAHRDDQGPTLQYHVAEALPLVVGDARYLKLAFYQLLHNAQRFTLPEGRVTMTAVAAAGQVRVDIEDTGVGIADKDLERIFHHFWRQDEAHSTPGLGLGLPLARRIIERHEGIVTVESEAGVGSLFRVALPAYKPQTHLSGRQGG